MSAGKSLLALNCQLPQFGGSRGREDNLAALIKRSGAGIVATQETDRAFLSGIVEAAGDRFHYLRAQGPDGRGLNGVVWDQEFWRLDVFHDWTLPSYGQWPRTLLAARLIHRDGSYVWAGSWHAAAAAPDLSRSRANVAAYAQTGVVTLKLDGYRQLILGADVKRTDDDDDLRLLRARGFTLNGRSSSTPQLTMTKARCVPGRSVSLDPRGATDHRPILTPFTVPKG